MNPFVLVNLAAIAAFILGLFGYMNWAIGSVLMVLGAGLSTMMGVFVLSGRHCRSLVGRLVAAALVPLSAWLAYLVGEWLNEYVFDGMVTLVAILYFVGLTLMLLFLGAKSSKAVQI